MATRINRLLALVPLQDARDSLLGAADRTASDTSGSLALFERYLPEQGCSVTVADLDDVWLEGGRIFSTGIRGLTIALDEFDAAMLFGFGDRATAMDRLQLLECAPIRYVTRPGLILLHHAKYGAGCLQKVFPVPATLAAAGARLQHRVANLPPGQRFVKPPAGSFGEGVALLPEGPDAAARALAERAPEPAYLLVQEAVTGTERRAILAGGRCVGVYDRAPAAGEMVANRARGGVAQPSTADADTLERLERLAETLADRGIGWAGVDLKGRCLLEINLANPGGLTTLAALEDDSVARSAASRLLSHLAKARPRAL